MMTSSAQGSVRKPKSRTKASHSQRGANRATEMGQTEPKTKERKASPQAAKRVKSDTKVAVAMDLLKRPEGATLQEMIEALSWKAHSVRGFLSGMIRKRMGLDLKSTNENGGRRYVLKS